jgi:hypothetical protein
VFRGAHTLTAAVVDGEGRELAASAPVQFFVQQTSVQNPNNPNTPQNPATPNNPNNPNQGGGGGE